MSKYILIFSKKGYAKYISHLDLNRLFRRSIRKQGITLAYSHGFNPHPKLSFGQPLSLGYCADREILEIETIDNYKPWYLKDQLNEVLPDGINIIDCNYLDEDIKSLAAIAENAIYDVEFSWDASEITMQKVLDAYLEQNEIFVLKKSKKKKEPTKVNIRDKIRNMNINVVNNNIIMTMNLDCGSVSNLSPELVISSFLQFADIAIERSNIEVTRKEIGFRGYII